MRHGRLRLTSLLLLALVILLTLVKITLGVQVFSFNQTKMPPWQPGFLDIHHLRVGPGQSSFIIMPDGTTLLIDAGAIDLPRTLDRLHQKKQHRYLKIRPPFPNASKTAAGWIVDYVQSFWPRPNEVVDGMELTLDFVLVTHFHCDHFGDISEEEAKSLKNGGYKLTGITEVGHLLRFGTLIDRAYPRYNFPDDLLKIAKIANYHSFVEAETKNGGRIERVEQFAIGSTNQIKMIHQDRGGDGTRRFHFLIRNLKSNLQYALTANEEIVDIKGELYVDKARKKYDENLLSTAIVIEYGLFRYYEGGDQEQQGGKGKDRAALDTITPTAKVAGKVHVATANHHGHGTNQAWINLVDPQVVILQGLFSDQPTIETMKLLRQRRSNNTGSHHRMLFVTDIYWDRLLRLGFLGWNAFAAKNGHVVVRVHEPVDEIQQMYEVYVLDSSRFVKAHFGPFDCSHSKL